MDAPDRTSAQEVTLIPGEIRRLLTAYMGSQALVNLHNRRGEQVD
jgi:hypothetical protein